MPIWVQHLIVALIVAAAVGYVAWQGFRALAGRRSKLGSCCAKGCSPESPEGKKPGGEQVVFLPVELLGAKSRRRD